MLTDPSPRRLLIGLPGVDVVPMEGSFDVPPSAVAFGTRLVEDGPCS